MTTPSHFLANPVGYFAVAAVVAFVFWRIERYFANEGNSDDNRDLAAVALLPVTLLHEFAHAAVALLSTGVASIRIPFRPAAANEYGARTLGVTNFGIPDNVLLRYLIPMAPFGLLVAIPFIAWFGLIPASAFGGYGAAVEAVLAGTLARAGIPSYFDFALAEDDGNELKRMAIEAFFVLVGLVVIVSGICAAVVFFDGR